MHVWAGVVEVLSVVGAFDQDAADVFAFHDAIVGSVAAWW
jgi:hypothetical protein